MKRFVIMYLLDDVEMFFSSFYNRGLALDFM